MGFAKALPQGILSELVVVLSDFPARPVPPLGNEQVDADPEQRQSVRRVLRSLAEPNLGVDGAIEVKPAIVHKSDSAGRISRRASGLATPLTPEQELGVAV
jgi:hypothetical protein